MHQVTGPNTTRMCIRGKERDSLQREHIFVVFSQVKHRGHTLCILVAHTNVSKRNNCTLLIAEEPTSTDLMAAFFDTSATSEHKQFAWVKKTEITKGTCSVQISHVFLQTNLGWTLNTSASLPSIFKQRNRQLEVGPVGVLPPREETHPSFLHRPTRQRKPDQNKIPS